MAFVGAYYAFIQGKILKLPFTPVFDSRQNPLRVSKPYF